MKITKLLSVVIVNYNTGSLLSGCLRSLAAPLKNISSEIVVIDNASADDSLTILESFPFVKVIKNSKNVGFSAAVNQGICESVGDYILWLNPDSEYQEGDLGSVLQYMKENADVAAVGLQIFNTDGSLQLSCRSFPSYHTAFFSRYSLLTRLFPQNPISRQYLKLDIDHTKVQEVDWVSGACLLHSRAIVDEIGLLDEQFYMYCEDVDFCLRAKKVGRKIVYHPGAKFLHHIGGASKKNHQRMIRERHRSMWRYYMKHQMRNPMKDRVVWMAIQMRCLIHQIVGLWNRRA